MKQTEFTGFEQVHQIPACAPMRPCGSPRCIAGVYRILVGGKMIKVDQDGRSHSLTCADRAEQGK